MGMDQNAFIEELRASGNVSRAAKAAGVSRQAAYEYRNNHPEFAAAWDDALQEGVDKLEELAFKLAHMKETSPSLLMFLLKAHRPSVYREPRAISDAERRELLADMLALVLRTLYSSLPEDTAKTIEGSLLKELSPGA